MLLLKAKSVYCVVIKFVLYYGIRENRREKFSQVTIFLIICLLQFLNKNLGSRFLLSQI